MQIYAGLYFATLVPTSRTGVVVNLLTPGLFKSSLSRHARFAMRAQVTIANLLFGRTIEMSSRSVLHAVVAGQKRKLLGGLHDADHALFVEQTLEKFLRIEDRAVPGEMMAE